MTQLTQDILEMLFDELGLNFLEWQSDTGYNSETWTDQMIYSALPGDIKDLIAEMGMNWSWLHDGM